MPDFLDRFATSAVSLHLGRSTFDRPFEHKTSFNEGQLIPFYCDEILPGDTFNVKTSALIRLSNPALKPVMDNMYLDVYYFFVPSRILWKHYEELHGANKTDAWTQKTEFVVPYDLGTNDLVVHSGSFYDYLGIPPATNLSTLASLSPLPYAAYCKIYDDFFRDENLQIPNFWLTTLYEAGSGTPVASAGNVASGIFNACRYHDYFSSCLPSPQKGAAVSLAIGGTAPLDLSVSSSGPLSVTGPAGLVQGGTGVVNFVSSSGSGGLLVNNGNNSIAYHSGLSVTGTADLSSATATTINSIRSAFQLQRLYERDARGGSRFVEELHSHYGVTNPDSRLQRPEYLGGCHQLLNMTSVTQTATGGTGLGNLAGYSVTGTTDGSFVKSFTEFGYVLGIAVVRVKHSYNQGVPRYLSRRRRFDFYYPEFANLGEQPVYTRELFSTADASTVFGFQEAWADYRYKPDLVTGQLRPGTTVDGTAWTYGDNYSAQPTLSSGWIRESEGNIDQTLAVKGATFPQFIADFKVANKATRVMPLFSVPGLLDHN